MNMRQVRGYLGGVSEAVVRRLKEALLKDKHFKLTRQKLFWVRHPAFMTDYQSANFIYQRLRWEERTKRRKKEEKEMYEPEYYAREMQAYLRGELGTHPSGHQSRIRIIGLDPFEGR